MASDSGRFGTADWTDAWLTAQRAALEQWLGTGDRSAAEMLRSGTDRWWQLWGAQSGRESRDAGDRLRSIGEQYLKGFRQVWAALGGHTPDPTGAEFQQRLHRSLLDIASGTAAQEFWTNLIPGLEGVATPAGSAGWSSALGNAAAEPWKLFFAVPPLGPARQQQAEWTQLQEALVAHQQLAGQLGAQLADLHREIWQRLAQRVADKARAGEPVQSFRALYDEWVNCGENVFAELANSPEYARLQAALGDSDAKLRIRVRGLVEQWCRSLDLPTRSELDTAHRRARDLSRRVDDLERQLAQLSADAAAAKPQAPTARSGRKRSAKPRKSPSASMPSSTDAGARNHGPHDTDA